MEGWMVRRTDVLCLDGCLDAWIDRWMNRCLDGWMGGWMNGCVYKWRVRVCICVWICMCVDVHVCLNSFLYIHRPTYRQIKGIIRLLNFSELLSCCAPR